MHNRVTLFLKDNSYFQIIIQRFTVFWYMVQLIRWSVGWSTLRYFLSSIVWGWRSIFCMLCSCFSWLWKSTWDISCHFKGPTRKMLTVDENRNGSTDRISTYCVMRLERRTAWNSEARAQHTQYASPASNYTTRTVPQSRPTIESTEPWTKTQGTN